MAKPKTGRITKQSGLAGLGHRMIRFRLKNLPKVFVVHEDVICANSEEFRSSFHTKRQSITSDSRCAICQLPLDPNIHNIEYCNEGCWDNFHESCIEKMKANAKGVAKCSTCSKTWSPHSDKVWRMQNWNLDPEAMRIYIDYIYTGRLDIDESLSRDDQPFNTLLLKLYSVGVAMKDQGLKNAIIHAYDEQSKHHFGTQAVEYAYGDDTYHEKVRELVVDVFCALVKPGWFRENRGKHPEAFMADLADACLERKHEAWGMEDVVRKYVIE